MSNVGKFIHYIDHPYWPDEYRDTKFLIVAEDGYRIFYFDESFAGGHAWESTDSFDYIKIVSE